MVFRNENMYKMDFEDSGGFGDDIYAYLTPNTPLSQVFPTPVAPEPVAPPPAPNALLSPVAPVADEPIYSYVAGMRDSGSSSVLGSPFFAAPYNPYVDPVGPVAPSGLEFETYAIEPPTQVVNPIGQQNTPAAQFADEPLGPIAPDIEKDVFGLPSLVEQKTESTQPTQPAQQPTQPTGPSKETLNALTQQILGQGLTGKWTGQGYGSAEKNAEDMAKILSGIGITDIKQFGKVTRQVEDYIGTDDSGTPMYQTRTEETFGNKQTGQAVPTTYSERQKGDFFGGTFEGKGNTGYGVKFDAQGNPLFYTQGASSSDIGNIAPLLTMASFIPGLAPFAQGINALIAAKQGNILGAVAGAAGLGGMTDVANAARFAGALKSGDPLSIAMAGLNTAGVSDIGGIDVKDISKTIGAIKAIESGDPLAMLRYGMGALPKGDGLTSSLGPGDMDEFRENLIPGYFQPGGEGYTSPKEPTPEPATEPVGDPYFYEPTTEPVREPIGDPYFYEPTTEPVRDPDEEITVREDPKDLDVFLRELGPYTEPETSVFTQREEIPELVMTDKRPTGDEHVFDPTFGGALPLPLEEEIPELVMTDKRPTGDEHVFDPTFGGELPLPELPTTPTAPVTTPKVSTPTKTPTVSTPKTTASPSSGFDLLGLLALLGGQQQPAQQTTMQDPYAHIKLMEDLFGPDIDLTPAGEDTAKRK